MKSEDLFRIALNPRMTPDAARVVIYYASLGDGEHPYEFDALSELLEEAGERRIRKALQRAERCGYLVRRKGGRNTDRFIVSPAPNAAESVDNSHSLSPALSAAETFSPAQRAGHTGLSPAQCAAESTPMGGGYMGGVKPPSSSSSKARAREDVENSHPVPQPEPEPARLEDLREWLGPDADAADALLPIAGSTTWAAAIIGKYGPSGTQEHAWGDIPEPRRPQIVAEALRDYAANGARPFRAKLFDGYVRSAREGPPRIAPGSEAASILANPRDPTPGAYRTTRSSGFATAGSALSSVVPPRVLERIRDSAREKLGEGAGHAELEQEVQRLTGEWDRHHGRQVAVR